MKSDLISDGMNDREMYTKIVVCPRCGGEGYTKKWNDREQEYDPEICNACGGLRVLKKTVIVGYEKIENEISKRDN